MIFLFSEVKSLNNKFPDRLWTRYGWFVGMLIQRKIFIAQGREMPTPIGLRDNNPELSILDSIKETWKDTAPRIDREDRKVEIKIQDDWIDISDKLEAVLEQCLISDKWIEDVGSDTRNLDMEKLTEILEEYVNELLNPRSNKE